MGNVGMLLLPNIIGFKSMLDLNTLTQHFHSCQHCGDPVEDVKYAYVLSLVDQSDPENLLATYQFIDNKQRLKRVVAAMFHAKCWTEIAGKNYSFDTSKVERFSRK